jgi:putative ABC transport system permease protein
VLHVTVRGLLAHKVRLVATTLAVLLGVSFVTATNVLAASVSTSFDRVFSDIYEDLDAVARSSVQIRTPFGPQRARVREAVVADIARVEGVTAVEGQVEGDLRVIGRDGEPLGADQGPPTSGLNWPTSPELNGWELLEGAPPTTPDQVVLDQRTTTDGGFRLGDAVDVAVQQGVRGFTLVGVVGFGDSDFEPRAALFETTTAQDLVAEPGMFDFIGVAADSGVSQRELTTRIASAVPDDVEVISGQDFIEESQDTFAEFIGLIEQALLVFGYVALGVGAFIIYNTFAIIIAQRTRELALLRALGASRRQVASSVVLEALVVGAMASILGIGVGIVIGFGLKVGLERLDFGLTAIPTVIRPGDIVLAFAIGTLVTTLSAVFPAIRASRVAPLAAMREVAYEHQQVTWRRVAAGLALLAAGVSMVLNALYRTSEDVLLGVGRGAAVAFIGVIVLGPVVARPLSRVLGVPVRRLGRVTGRIARENAMRNPRRTAATSSALMIGVGLVGFISVLAASFQASITDAIDKTVGADIIVNPVGGGGGPGNGLSPTLADDLAASPAAALVSRQRVDFAEVDGTGQFVVAVDPATFPEIVRLDIEEGAFADLAAGGIAVPRSLADEQGWSVGTVLPARFLQQSEAQLPVVAIYDTDLPFAGAGLFISTELFDRTFPLTDRVDDVVYVTLADGIDGATGAAILQPIVDQYPTAKLQDLDQFKQEQVDEIGQFLLVIYALLALALVIAVIGIVNTLLLSVHERTREIGLVRAIGMRRGQVASSVFWEALLIALIGTTIGLVVAVFFGWAVISALADQGARVFAVPARDLVLVVVLAAVAGLMAALYPAFRASRLDVLEAIATE